MQTCSRRRQLRGAAFIAVFIGTLVALAGCDTIDPGREPVIVQVDQVFRFETTLAQLSQGTTANADVRLDVSQALAQYGFGTGDILGAEIVEATLERVQPVGASLNALLSSASVRATTASLPEITLASSTTMSAAATQPLNIASVNNLGAYLRAGNATVRLALQPGPSLESQNYVFRVRLRLRITLEGV